MIVEILANAFFNGCGYILVALGMSLVFGVLNIINTAHNMYYVVGAYILYSWTIKLGLGYFPSILLSMICIALFAFLLEILIYKRLKIHVMQIIASNGLAIFLAEAIRIIWTSNSVVIKTPLQATKMQVGPILFTAQRLSVVVAAFFAVIFIEMLIHKTRFGLMMRALPQDPMAASLNGINVARISAVTFMIAGTLAVLASATMAPMYALKPNIAESIGNKTFAIVVFGGIGSVSGTVVAAFVIALIESFIAGYIASGYENLVVFIILILTLIFRPSGLMGKK